jgi:hypothetical protein
LSALHEKYADKSEFRDALHKLEELCKTVVELRINGCASAPEHAKILSELSTMRTELSMVKVDLATLKGSPKSENWNVCIKENFRLLVIALAVIIIVAMATGNLKQLADAANSIKNKEHYEAGDGQKR